MRRRLAPAAGALGLILLVTGTFLPWLRSGDVRRNSYQAGGALRALVDLPGLLDVAVRVWPFVGLWCAGVVVGFVLGAPRFAALLGLLAGLLGSVVATATLQARGSGLIAASRSGPSVTLAGSLIVISASLSLVTRAPTLTRRRS
ncbi:MAG: hypothetical protein QOE97_3472 [Pseudonocardiales bacterium]|nr:hypothetical protein [Pseudonocardiales bacterium]